MGTMHYGVVQQQGDNNKAQWWTIATFEFNKDYELFRWLHAQKKGEVYPRAIEDFHSLGPELDDMCCYQVFYEEDLFVDGHLMAEFRYGDIEPEMQGKPAFIYEAMIATFKLTPGHKRIVICQDQ